VTERSFVMVKPDAVARGFTGEIIARIERRGLRLIGLKKALMTRSAAEEHYAEHCERPFFGELVEFITSGPVVMMAVEGPGAIGALRTMMGPTDPQGAPPGTIRGDLALTVGENAVHGSDGAESAARELALHFGEQELVPAPAPVR
jgi:nucleoside-diphosphate kinase